MLVLYAHKVTVISSRFKTEIVSLHQLPQHSTMCHRIKEEITNEGNATFVNSQMLCYPKHLQVSGFICTVPRTKGENRRSVRRSGGSKPQDPTLESKIG